MVRFDGSTEGSTEELPSLRNARKLGRTYGDATVLGIESIRRLNDYRTESAQLHCDQCIRKRDNLQYSTCTMTEIRERTSLMRMDPEVGLIPIILVRLATATRWNWHCESGRNQVAICLRKGQAKIRPALRFRLKGLRASRQKESLNSAYSPVATSCQFGSSVPKILEKVQMSVRLETASRFPSMTLPEESTTHVRCSPTN